MGRLILSKLVSSIFLVACLTGSAFAQEQTSASAAADSNSSASVDFAASTTAPVAANTTALESLSTTASAAQGNPGLAEKSQRDLPDWATSSTENLSPVNNVHPFPVGTEWAQRLYSVGITPETLWVAEKTTLTAEQERDLMAHRHYFMGWYYLELNQAGRALEEFSNALKFDPDNTHVLLDAARAHLAVREVSDANKLVDQVLDQETTNVEAMRLRAETGMAAADAATGSEKDNLLKKAVSDLEKARELQPKNLQVLRALARAYVQQQEGAKVISVYKDIVSVDPRDTYSLLILAQVLSRLDRPQEAIPYYKRVIEQRRSFIGGYIFLGQIYERLKRYGDALELYKQALLVDPRNADVLRRFEELINQINGAKNTSKVLDAYKKFVNEYPGNTEIRRIYAEKLITEKKLDLAIDQYKAILDTDPENVDACVSLGALFAEQKKFDKASEYLNKAVEINPDRLDLYDTIASMLLAQDDKGAAVKMYQKAIDANPRAEKLYISLAALLENDDKTSQATTVMENAIAKVGDKPELLAVLGKFYRSQGQIEKADKTLRKAYDKEPSNLPLFGELLSVYLQEDKTSAAEEITSRTAEKASQGKDMVYSVAAEFYVNAGKSAQAVNLLVSALQANPTQLEHLARLIQILDRQKRFDESLQYLEDYGHRMKDQEKVDMVRAQVYSDSGKFDEAIKIFKRIISEHPLDLNYYQFYIDVLNDAKKFDEAHAVLKQAREKFGKTDADAIAMMTGMVYYKQKKYAQAEKTFSAMAARSGDKNEDAYYFLGSVYLDQKNYSKAEKALQKAIEINPTSANALNALGYLYAERGVKLDEAKKLISKALEINPTAPHILDSMGWVLFKQGDVKGAAEYVERAARQFDDAEIYVHLGEIYAKQGDLQKAREKYKHALELDPTRTEIKEKLKHLPESNENK